jgi:hypothetical protein
LGLAAKLVAALAVNRRQSVILRSVMGSHADKQKRERAEALSQHRR